VLWWLSLKPSGQAQSRPWTAKHLVNMPRKSLTITPPVDHIMSGHDPTFDRLQIYHHKSQEKVHW